MLKAVPGIITFLHFQTIHIGLTNGLLPVSEVLGKPGHKVEENWHMLEVKCCPHVVHQRSQATVCERITAITGEDVT